MATIINFPIGNGLREKAYHIAKDYKDKGAIIITSNEDGDVRIGTEGLTPEELREALCTAIHYSYQFDRAQNEEGL